MSSSGMPLTMRGGRTPVQSARDAQKPGNPQSTHKCVRSWHPAKPGFFQDAETGRLNPFERRLEHAGALEPGHVVLEGSSVLVILFSPVSHSLWYWQIRVFLGDPEGELTQSNPARACRPVSAWDTRLSQSEALEEDFVIDCMNHFMKDVPSHPIRGAGAVEAGECCRGPGVIPTGHKPM